MQLLRGSILVALFLSSSVFANTSTYVYCALPDGEHWDWLVDGNDNYETIEGQWARINQVDGTYFKAFRVSEELFNSKAFTCPGGYVPQPADSGTSRWEIFEVIRADGSSYFIDGYKTYYRSGSVVGNSAFRL